MQFEYAYAKACKTRADLCRQCKTNEDLLLVATAFAFQAGIIWEEMGGAEHAAHQLYAAADRMASKASTPRANDDNAS